MIRGYSDHAANERTFLAWVRTGIAVIAFGFVIEKFNLFLDAIAREAAGDATHQFDVHNLSGPFGRYVGLALIFGGLGLLLFATARFLRTGRLLDAPEDGQGNITIRTPDTVTLLPVQKRKANA